MTFAGSAPRSNYGGARRPYGPISPHRFRSFKAALTITAEDRSQPSKAFPKPTFSNAESAQMLIDCPSCAKSYHISRAALGSRGRNVACPHCLTSWFVTPDAKGIADLDIAANNDFETEDAGFAVPEINVEAISERTRQPTYEELYGPRVKAEERVAPAPQLRVPRLPRAAVTVTVALGLVMGVIAGRATIVRLWPQAAKIYAVAGLPVNERGLDLKNLHVNLIHNGAQALLVVDGEIANKRGDKTPVPKIKLAVRDAGGHEIYTWDEASPKAKLDSGETIAFRARLVAPPAEGRDIFVRFAAADAQQTR
jgi:predicted Zn finger-like uncharacterized protein